MIKRSDIDKENDKIDASLFFAGNRQLTLGDKY